MVFDEFRELIDDFFHDFKPSYKYYHINAILVCQYHKFLISTLHL